MKMKRTQVGLHFISITIASIAKGWKSTIWEDFKNCSIQTVCSDEIQSCQGEVKWGNLKEKLSDAQILFVIDQQRNLQKALSFGDALPFDLDHFKDQVCSHPGQMDRQRLHYVPHTQPLSMDYNPNDRQTTVVPPIPRHSLHENGD